MKEKPSFWTKLKETIVALIVVSILLGGLGGCHYMHWKAYQQRYPDASYWTYWFRNK